MFKHIVSCLGALLLWQAGAAASGDSALPDSLAAGRVLHLAAVPAHEGEAVPDTLKVSWQDILRLADRHPRLAAGRLGVAAARGAARAAGALPNPTLDATLGRARALEGSESRREWELALTLPLGWIAERGPRVEAAMAQVDASLEEARAVRRDVLLELRILFWNLAHDQARVAALEALQSQTAELARLVSRRVEKGEARPSEATRVEIELEKVANQLESGWVSRRARQGQLGLWVHGGPGSELVVDADLASVPDAGGLDQALAASRSGHPLLEAARARLRALSSEAGAEKRAWLRGAGVRGFVASELDARSSGGGIALDLPLWNWNSGPIAQARAQREAARRELEWETRKLESAVIEAHAACEAASRAAARYRDRIIPRSESAASIMEKTYRLGEASLLELIDARRVLVETRLEYLAALAQAQLDYSRLRALVSQEDAP